MTATTGSDMTGSDMAGSDITGAAPPKDPAKRPVLRLFCSRVLDFFTVAAIYGWVTGTGTFWSVSSIGSTTRFSALNLKLDGAHLFYFAAIILLYFIAGRQFGGTPWKRLLGLASRR